MSESVLTHTMEVEQNYDGLENMNILQETENSLFEALLISGMSIGGIMLISVLIYILYNWRRIDIYKKMEFEEKMGELEHREEIELEMIKKKELEVYEEHRVKDNGGGGEGSGEESGEYDKGDKDRSE